MNREQDRQRAENLERVIGKNLEYLDRVAEDLMTACLSARSLPAVPQELVEAILKDYDAMQVRLAEARSAEQFLLRHYGTAFPEDPDRRQLMADLDVLITGLVARPPQPPPRSTPSERWLRVDDNSLSFTINARLLDELEYETPQQPGGPVRVVQRSGRGFTLFTLRGPASALDALHPCIRLRQHDIVERFSATEIRGVLTHLRRTLTADIRHVFERLLTSRFSDVTCILVGLHAPDQLDEYFLKYLDRTAAEMHAGEIRTIDIADHT